MDSPEKALAPDAPNLHPGGNILHRAGHKKGDLDKGFADCSVIVEETYELPRQMHAYMETEGGVVVPELDGKITVYVGTQHGFKDRFQLARILAIPETDIRVVSSPIGGSFGGKDELNIQPYGALLAMATNCPVKIHQSRRESVRAGLKRHPMKITMKTGSDKYGKILAHKVKIISDTGAYSTLGPAVLDFAVEHAAGPYVIPNVDVEGVSVFTNNGVSGEFRGFGGNQVTFALEGQIDRLAERLKMNPIEFRRKNLRNANDLGPMGQRIAPTNGAIEVLEAIEATYSTKISSLKLEKDSKSKSKVTGAGISLTMHGGGLGVGRLDPAGGRLSLSRDGKLEAAFGFEECGQGLLSVIETLLVEEFKCSADDTRIVVGDTALVPISGSSTASRATSMVWQSLQKMKGPFIKKIVEQAAKILEISSTKLQLGPSGIYHDSDTVSVPCITYAELAQKIPLDNLIVENSAFDFPTSPDSIIGSHFLYSFAAVFVHVEVDLLTGMVTVIDLDQAIAAGPVVSPMGYLGQIEGGGVMALGYSLMEDALMENGVYAIDNLDSYLIPTIGDIPSVLNVEAIEKLCDGDQFGPRGVGEIGSVAVAPAIARAIYDAIGCWVSRLPVSPEYLLKHVSQGS
jgi:xanthine dehydrogenase D subunit